MPSLQQPAGGSKSAKFVQVNPLDPMIRPFQNGNEPEEDVQGQVAKNVNDRLEKAMEELKEKHRRGTNEVDDPDRAPTGLAYQRVQQQQQQQKQQQQKQQSDVDQIRRNVAENLTFKDNDDDDDSDYDDLLDDDYHDPIMEELRQRRMLELKQAQEKKAQHLALGHGQYRLITQDEFLPECTGSSEYVAVHFFHNDFERCKIMEHHLKLIAPHHLECKFLCLNAEKAPFFVEKLQIRTLPTLIVFREGKALQRLTGFEGLQPANANDPDSWKTSSLQEWLGETGAINYRRKSQSQQNNGSLTHRSIYRGTETYDEDC